MADALKRAARERMKVTGEKYTEARRAILAEKDPSTAVHPSSKRKA